MYTELTEKQIAELAGKSRIRGLYKQELDKFMNSDMSGVEVNLSEGEFANKTVSTVSQGFRTAIEKNGYDGKVRVQPVEDKVFLIRVSG
jgi:hypothetical protein